MACNKGTFADGMRDAGLAELAEPGLPRKPGKALGIASGSRLALVAESAKG